MINFFKNKINKYTGILIRLDDIAENMNWELMDKCEILFDKYNIKPLLGVIPNNQDPELLKYPKNERFWEKVSQWKKKEWEITMHGYSHLYTQKSDKKDIFNYGGNSEFYGLNYHEQLDKIKNGIIEFEKRGIQIRSFFAPNHIYDEITLRALKDCNINIVIDGYGLFPFFKNGILFIPQLFYREILLPFGIQSTQIHLNYWSQTDFNQFEQFIKKNADKILHLDYILNLEKPNLIKNTINYTLEKTIKTIRAIR